jgi:hypothetical protein
MKGEQVQEPCLWSVILYVGLGCCPCMGAIRLCDSGGGVVECVGVLHHRPSTRQAAGRHPLPRPTCSGERRTPCAALRTKCRD